LTEVPAGARVLVDGSEVPAPGPGDPILLDLGTRTLRVERPGFVPFERVLEITGGAPLEVPVTLAQAPATEKVDSGDLTITSSGTRDIIAIDGKVVGSGRFRGQVAAGKHRVQVTAEGKRPFETQIELLSGGQRTMQIALEDERKPKLWPWIAGGAALAVGAVVGGYFALRSDDTPDSVPVGKLGTVQVKFGRSQ
jgi:hypothetical protein